MTVPAPISGGELYRRERRASFVSRLFVLVAGVAVATLLVAQLAGLIVIRQQQVVNSKTNNETHSNSVVLKDLARRIVSCTEPTGQCFKDGQARTGEAVASINQVVIYAVACSKVIPNQGDRTFTEIQTCVEARLKAAQ